MRKSNDKNIKKFTSRMQARLLLVFCAITVLLLVLIGRLVYLMRTDGERYAKQVLSRQSYVSAVLPFKRGSIYDRNGTEIARSELRYKLILDSKYLTINSEYLNHTVEEVSKFFGMDKDALHQTIREKAESQYYVLSKNLLTDQVNEFKEIMSKDTNIKGIWFEQEYLRTYPYASLGADVIGFTSTDNTGFWGIEEYYNSELNGINGREYGYYDSSLDIERIVKKPVNGNSIVTTIDINAQRIIQKHIKEFNDEYGSKSIGILVMNPNNGEIIAMASNEEYDLNNPRSLDEFYTADEIAAMTQEDKMEALNKIWRNDIISNSFEPGSTFKPVTIAAALEEAIITPDTTFFCDGGEWVNGTYIRCSSYRNGGHGHITLEEALMKSCNDAMMQIVNELGRKKFYAYQTSVGLGGKSGIDLPGETTGIIFSEDKLNPVELATSSFGQGFASSMVQMAAAYSSMVNGGYYYQPHVMKSIVSDDGATLKKVDSILVRKAISTETSELLQKYLYATVEEGTAKPAKVEGYAVGGKTGTAQKLPRDAKTYVVSFLGAVPAINPEIVIYVMIDEAQNVPRQDDSSLATKLASRVLTELLPALGIFPDGEIDYLIDKEEKPNSEQNTQSPGNGNSQTTDPNVNNENQATEPNEGSTNENQVLPGDNHTSNEEEGSNPMTENQEANQGTEGENLDNQSNGPPLEDDFAGDILPAELDFNLQDEIANLEENEANEPLNE